MHSRHPKPVQKNAIKLDPNKVRALSDEQLGARIKMLTPILQGVSSADPEASLAFRAAVTGIGNGEIRDYAKALKGLKNELHRRDRERGTLQAIPWTPFARAYADPAELDKPEALARFESLAKADTQGRTAADYRALYEQAMLGEMYRNSRYQVAVNRQIVDDGEGGVQEMVHLSIKRNDQKTIHDWRDMQRIKNELVGPECEGIELYPAESRCVDTANQYHMWCVNSGTFRWPVGWHTGGLKMDSAQAGNAGAMQRDFEA